MTVSEDIEDSYNWLTDKEVIAVREKENKSLKEFNKLK